MEAYVKRFSDFSTYAKLDITVHDAALDSIYDEQSTFTAIGQTEIEEGDWFILGDFIGRIFSTAPGEGNTTDIVCDSLLNFFSRSLVYPGDESKIEAFIASEMTDNFKSVSDTEFDMPYLTITSTDATDFIKPDIEDGLYSLKSYIAKARRIKSVFVTFAIDGNTLLVDIAPKVRPSHNIVMDDGKHVLVSQTLSRNSISKITTIQGVTVKDWYLNTDGSITNDAPAIRVAGQWIKIPLSEDDVDSEIVADEFSKNSYSHKIEFRSSLVYGFYDSVVLKIKDKVLSSYISCIRTDSGDSRYLYKTGELRTTLTDKLKEMN